MPKNPDIGEIRCPCCRNLVPVRKSVKSKLYFVCTGCGLFPMAYPGGQDWILEHATFHGPADTPAPDPESEPDEGPEPEPVPRPSGGNEPPQDPPRKKGILEDWLP